MKYITLIIGLLVVGCGEQEQTDANESTPTTNTNKVDGTTEKPDKELTLEEKVVGAYELKKDGDTMRMVFLDNGIMEAYLNGKKDGDGKWMISKEGELHVAAKDGIGSIAVNRINKDGSITWIAVIIEGKRTEFPKENQMTFNKIK
jgi:hypothetical protein